MEKIKMTKEESLNLAQMFKILGDPTRLKILEALKENGDFNVTCIAEVCEISQSATSHQLSVLKKYRLIKGRRSGKQIYYSLDDNHVLQILDIAREHVLDRK